MHCPFDARILLIFGAIAFLVLQMRLFATQSDYADRIAAAVESENRCISQLKALIDQISSQQGRIVSLEEQNKRLDTKVLQLSTRIVDFENQETSSHLTSAQPVAAVVVMACNRADYLDRTVQSILKYHNSVSAKFPLFISQDGTDQQVRLKARSFPQFTYMQHLDDEPIHTQSPGEIIAYYKIARHYKWALSQLFDRHSFSRVIILEDDMELAPDFFDYFEATASLLDKDSSLIAVSSWNDNGQRQFVQDPEALYRSDFFPGLGWMLKKSLWTELAPKWPKAYWDDWLRLNETRKGRQFIRPEVCRTYNFGEHGSSFGQFFRQYLETIKLNDVQVNWKEEDLTYLMEENYKKHFAELVSKAVPVPALEAAKAYNIDGDVRIEYDSQRTFEAIARQFGIFQEWKDGVPRTAYKGVVVFRWQTSRYIFVIGPHSLKDLGIN
ncbi:alpha-1,3-mannosyl-glycoprotein 2-beta-N-acetylglucosaminyltransferase-like [Selaginella moellendorffii]|uniref:alpha-1,3-mannosyl-glycoprotein 2-beta-N-acetylglucosaminyltransferase-like n=1 Tax=Selaginella moellendorffii TaxID=88036 RepID=UPI000D1CF054|nr:alpha-1,3-mannosyl-glycoprotein 2-beta-N-acetylglucosaminyltransferase-like [Selaginella moellendorffii]|eukprot:XP_024518016.1 alpha-1,3-mannosyl-glycoprotein 2-beta-N-acetylglucosaminyltransferase-like [Selaginella moellendorffii]